MSNDDCVSSKAQRFYDDGMNTCGHAMTFYINRPYVGEGQNRWYCTECEKIARLCESNKKLADSLKWIIGKVEFHMQYPCGELYFEDELFEAAKSLISEIVEDANCEDIIGRSSK